MEMLKPPLSLLIVIGLGVAFGCRMCASPHDYTGPVMSPPEQGRSCSSLRAGSAFVGVAAEEQGVLAAAPAPSGPTPNRFSRSVRVTSPPVRGTKSAEYGRPLTPEDLDPFIKLGIPPENILSVTDRPLDEVVENQPTIAADGVTATTEKQPKRLSSVEKNGDTANTGWVRLGNRSSTALR
ncbi:MAG: hypothetical protein ACUVQG_13255 [Thermogutta sp.]